MDTTQDMCQNRCIGGAVDRESVAPPNLNGKKQPSGLHVKRFYSKPEFGSVQR